MVVVQNITVDSEDNSSDTLLALFIMLVLFIANLIHN